MPLPIQQIVVAVGGLGTASYGLVDATKALPAPLTINNAGFRGIGKTVAKLTPTATGNGASVMPRTRIIGTLRANWFAGTGLSDQKAIAKSLIKLNLHPTNAKELATATGVDAAMLSTVAEHIATGTSLAASESDVYARFDLIVTTMLDEAYQRGDAAYRNMARVLAMGISIVLALVGALVLNESIPKALLFGLLATPLAPVAKDLSSALGAALAALQSTKK